MKVTTITKTVRRTVSDNNYGAYGSEITATAELEEDETLKDASRKLRKTLTAEVDSDVRALVEGTMKPMKKKE